MRWIPSTSGRKQLLMATSMFFGLVVLIPMVIAGENAESSGQWTNISENFLKASGKNSFRHALAVERTTGNLFVSRWATGVWMSVDQGVTFNRVDGNKISGGGPFSCYDLFMAPVKIITVILGGTP